MSQGGSALRRNPGRAGGLLVLAVLAAGAVLALAVPPAIPPPVVPASAAAGEFSAERARPHLRVLARAPRPVGSPAHEAVREYLVEALAALGLEVELQHATGLRRSGDTVRAAALVNVMARLPGTASTGAVVLASHYDSVPNTFGAADAGHGVAAILETVRALASGPPLDNDVIVLITDAEEVGLLGAQAWVDEHPWAVGTGIVLNAEARGHAGPVWMFRTGPDNGRMIETLARAAPYPTAVSVANAVFQRLPNDTDATVFYDAGLAAMDFGNVRGLTHYHTPLDNYENADPRTLQHHGSYLLSLARAFGTADLATLAAPPRVYFSLPYLGLLHYPEAWGPGLALGAAALVLIMLILAARHGQLSAGGVAVGGLHFAVLLAGLPLLAHFGWRALAEFVPELPWFTHGAPYDGSRYMLGLGLLAAALYWGASVAVRGRVSPAEQLVAPLLAWALLAVASALWLPGGSYVFLWPLLFALVGLACWRPEPGLAQAVVLAVAALPALLFVLPLADELRVALTLRQVAVPVALLVLGLGLLALQLALVARAFGAWPAALLAAAGAAVLGHTLYGAGLDASRPKPNSVHYLADADAGEARWYSTDPEPDEWTRHYLGAQPERGPLPDWAPPGLAGPANMAWQRAAPLLQAGWPRAELVAESQIEHGRRLRVRLHAPAGAQALVLRFPGTAITSLSVDGREAKAEPAWDTDKLQLIYAGVPAAGADLEIATAGEGPVRLTLRANLSGLPPVDVDVPPRPESMMPAGALGDLTRLQRSFEFR
jgi:hypothetical protein